MSSLQDPDTIPDFESWLRGSGLLRQAYFYTRNAELAEDIAQDAAIKAYKAWDDSVKREMILSSPRYVNRIVRHCFLDHLKARKLARRSEVELDVDRHDRPGISNDHDELHAALLRLDEPEQLMIKLKYYNGLTIKEASQKLGLSYPQATRLHAKALSDLARLLDEGEA
jgi:RNA polymerase sigma factor (sigma-70 family)